jgi:lipoyl(octanoyl) transferase
MESTTAVSGLPHGREPSSWGVALLLVSRLADGATNMAIDEALLRRAGQRGETLFRVYGWTRPTVSLGRNQPARGCYDLDVAERRGIDFVRRPTGGRAILHHREITYSVAAPISAFGSLSESYRAVNRLLLEALRALGVCAEEATSSSRAPIPSLAPCFDSPVMGELVSNGRKLVGSAQVRDGDAFLQHGSVLVDDDQHLLSELLVDARPVSPPATLRALTSRVVTVGEFAAALAGAIGGGGGSAPGALEVDESLLDDVRTLCRTRYSDADWTWRR